MRKSFIIIIVHTLFEEFAIPMIVGEDAVDHILKNPPQCDRSRGCAHGPAVCIKTCTEWCSSNLWWGSCKRKNFSLP